MNKHLVILMGPTAVGKTAVAIQLAERLGTEIVSADARQFYQQLDIGTAKPTEQERSRVRHHLVDHLPITQSYSAAAFVTEALQALEQIWKKSSFAIVAGGSGFYIEALCKGVITCPAVNPMIREELTTLYEEQGLEGLLALLQKKDPTSYGKIDRANPRRILRALEVSIATQQPFSSYQPQLPKPLQEGVKMIPIGLLRDRETLYHRIDQRVEQMIKEGLVEEVKGLTPFASLPSLQTIGYQEFFPYFKGVYSLAEAIRLVKRNSRRYAKRQITFFRRDKSIRWFSADELEAIIGYVNGAVG